MFYSSCFIPAFQQRLKFSFIKENTVLVLLQEQMQSDDPDVKSFFPRKQQSENIIQNEGQELDNSQSNINNKAKGDQKVQPKIQARII